MIKKLIVANYLGDKIAIELRKPEESGFLIKSITGLGPSKANINTTEVSTNDGSMYNSSRVNQRNIVIDLVFVNTENGESIEDVRQKSYKFFPVKKKLDILIETDNRLLSAQGYVESNEPIIFSSQETSQISIICPDPYFYSAGESETTIFYGIEAAFEFPFSNESLSEKLLVLGYIQNKTENVITYNGDSEIGITIHIHAIGTVSNITIYNIGTREKMKINTDKLKTLTGFEMIAGDDIVLCTTKGNKQVTLFRGGRPINIMNCIDKGTNWFVLAKGDNMFAFVAESGTTNLQFWIENRIIYEGV